MALRERAAFDPARLQHALNDLKAHGHVHEATILSTCNRTEIYCRQDDVDPDPVVHWVCRYKGLPDGELNRCVYHHPDESAVQHAFRVAAGLDSMVLGEPQILGQMKDAFAEAHRTGATGKILNRLFQHTFSVAKRVRTDTTIGVSAVSVAYAAVDLAKRIFSNLSEQTVLMIGAGDTIELTARHLKRHQVSRMIVANRSVERAERLARDIGSEAIALAELPGRLAEADIVIASTASTLPILGKGAVERALRQRRHRPMFMVDLAVPRDIEAEVGELRDVYLYTVDDLEGIVEQNIAARREAADEAMKIIDLQVARFMHWMRSLDSVPTIRGLRDRVEDLSRGEVERALRRIDNGEDPKQVVMELARAMSNKYTHKPSDVLRRAGIEGDPALLAAARKLFGVGD